MSASTRSVPAQVGLGRFPSTLAGLALVVILAVAVAIVALNGTKAAPVAGGATTTGTGFGHGPGDWYYTRATTGTGFGQGPGDFYYVPTSEAGAPPAVIDHGSSNGETVILPKTIPHFGGWGGPRVAPDSQWNPAYIAPALKGPVYLGDNSKDDKYILSNPPYTGGAPRGVGSRAQ